MIFLSSGESIPPLRLFLGTYAVDFSEQPNYCSVMQGLQEIQIDYQKLRDARGERGLTEVARTIGISKQQLWNYENAFSEPSPATLAKLCLLYQIQIETLTNATEKLLKKLYTAA